MAHHRRQLTRAEYLQARRVFEATLEAMQHAYQAPEDFMVDATATDATGAQIVVARYKIYTDGRIQCFEVLHADYWPTEEEAPGGGAGE